MKATEFTEFLDMLLGEEDAQGILEMFLEDVTFDGSGLRIAYAEPWQNNTSVKVTMSDGTLFLVQVSTIETERQHND